MNAFVEQRLKARSVDLAFPFLAVVQHIRRKAHRQ